MICSLVIFMDTLAFAIAVLDSFSRKPLLNFERNILSFA